jgi:hypothetical protein
MKAEGGAVEGHSRARPETAVVNELKVSEM